jgi:mono/diheme cytochrome c family protein/rhodanese-related sulfurtransferase
MRYLGPSARRALAQVIALLGSWGCSSTQPPKPPPDRDPATLDPQAVDEGEKLYDKYCKLCHGAAGAGYAADHANQLRNPTFLATASDSFLRMAIIMGRPGTPMSAFGSTFGGPLGPDEIDRLLDYLRSLQRTAKVDVEEVVVEGDGRAATELFAKQCARCHGASGGGKTALSLNNPLFLATAGDGFIRYAIENGRPGTPMPAFGERLAAADIDNLTSLIRSWARNVDYAPVAGDPPPAPESVVVNPDGPPPSFPELREQRYVPAEAVSKALSAGARMVLLDARPMSDWLRAHIPGAIPVPFYSGVHEIAARLPRDGTWIVAYCGCPHAASGKVIDELRAEGFSNTAVIDEGIFVWMERGYPLTFGRSR